MAGTITPESGGAITCDFLKGSFPTARSRIDTFVRRGFDGFGLTIDARTSPQFKLIATKFGGLSTITSWAEDVESAVSAVCTIENDMGASVDDAVILEASVPIIETAIRHALDDGYRCTITLTVQRQTTNSVDMPAPPP